MVSSIISFSQRYGSLFVPIAADLAVYAIFRRATWMGTIKNASTIVGLGVSYFFGRQTSTAIGLTGIALYLAYKIIAHDYLYPIKPSKHLNIDDLEQSYSKLAAKLTYTCDRQLDEQDDHFKDKFKSLLAELKSETDTIRAKWDSPAVLDETRQLLINCQTLLFQIQGKLEKATEQLWLEPKARDAEMARLLKEPGYDENEAFNRALLLLNLTYRSIRGRIFVISLPHLRNPTGDKTFVITVGVLNSKDNDRFFDPHQPHFQLKNIFNTTQERLTHFVKVYYNDARLLVNDEQPTLGDYGNPDNPFRINLEVPKA